MPFFAQTALAEDRTLTGSSEDQHGSGEYPQISVEIVSARSFDPEKNASNLKIVKDTIDNYSKSEGIRYPSDNIKQSVQNHGGKFAVLFETEDAKCDEVLRFINGAKKHSNEVVYAILNCEGQPSQII
ncbi:unnamed protein product [Caenorhabditis bovis]|uniref:Uncharacterized protein n=1 Tax=Caenorhabditis bovis TaxID=2654633 RepID=A0A8S1EE39_9PELO|nr:unnamed protein product [Caenorhabditis bovis]